MKSVYVRMKMSVGNLCLVMSYDVPYPRSDGCQACPQVHLCLKP
jgi:hypothetical protein